MGYTLPSQNKLCVVQPNLPAGLRPCASTGEISITLWGILMYPLLQGI